MLPSPRANAANGATRAPAGGATDGHTVEQPPLHVEWFGVARSASKTYTVNCELLTKPGAPKSCAVASAPLEAGADGAAVAGATTCAGESGLDPPPLQPASNTRATLDTR